jgi:plasmid stabilization system protein ParE
MGFQVFLSKDALSDLERIVAYIAPHNPVAARRLGDDLLDAAFSLSNMPGRGRMVPEFRRPELREVVVRSHRVIYRIQENEECLEIVRFWHAARGFPHIPFTL